MMALETPISEILRNSRGVNTSYQLDCLVVSEEEVWHAHWIQLGVSVEMWSIMQCQISKSVGYIGAIDDIFRIKKS